MNFKIPPDKVVALQIDLLGDIYCWQQVILEHLAATEAVAHDVPMDTVMDVFEKRKDEIRKDLTESLFEKYGPDLSQDLALDEPQNT